MKDKVIVITGASQGLGRELALQLSKLGAIVALVARTEKLLADLKTEINTNGGVAEYFVCDVTKLDNVNETIDKVVAKFNHIDVLINNAGVYVTNKQEEENPNLIESTFLVNSIGPIYFSRAVTPIFEKNNSGHFVFINSIAGLDVAEIKKCSVYAATKWALTGFAKSLAFKYSDTPIKVTSIHPGPFVSDVSNSSAMNIAEVAEAVIYTINAPDKIQIGTIDLKKMAGSVVS